jgi:hypothetical protein
MRIPTFEHFISTNESKYELHSIYKPKEKKDSRGKNRSRIDVKFRKQINDNAIHYQYFSVRIDDNGIDIVKGATTTPIWKKDDDGNWQTAGIFGIKPYSMTTSDKDMKYMIGKIHDMYKNGDFDDK